jgi:hypothetical protein
MAVGKRKRAGKGAAARKAKTRPSARTASCAAEADHNIINLGTTRIADKYGRKHGRVLIGLLDAGLRTVYVARDAHARVRRLFRGRAGADGTWLIPFERKRLLCRVKAIDELDTSRPVRTTDVFAVANRYCVVYPKGTCVNFYYDDGRFAYSWKAIADVGLCARKTGECKEIVQANQVTLYPGKNCTGRAIKQNVDWQFCEPP